MATTDREGGEAPLMEHSEQLALLFDASSALLRTKDPLALIEQLYARLSEMLGLEVYVHFAVAADGSHLYLAASAGFTSAQRESLRRLEFGQAVCGTVARERARRVVNDVQASAGPMTEAIRSVGIEAYVCHPLIVDGELFGTLSFGTKRQTAFPPGAVELVRAVSDLVALAIARSRAEEGLREADRRKDEFLALLAHELRNPLAAVRNGLDVLHAAEDLPPHVQQIRAPLERQTQQLVRLVDDLLESSRIGQQRFELRRQPVALDEVVTSALEQIRPELENAGHTLRVELPSEAVILEADPVRLSQVIANLLDNAVKYTPAGGHIEVEAEVDGGHVDLCIRDDGPGIPADKAAWIFESYRRLEPDARVGGLGLGLALVKSLVEMHGGRVEARSPAQGRGAEFGVRLPLSGEREPAREGDRGRSGPHAAPREAVTQPAAAKTARSASRG